MKKYTYKQVLDMVNSTVVKDYTEVLKLTREEKDKKNEEENKREKGRKHVTYGVLVKREKGAKFRAKI